jgi:hypothetical protein
MLLTVDALKAAVVGSRVESFLQAKIVLRGLHPHLAGSSAHSGWEAYTGSTCNPVLQQHGIDTTSRCSNTIESKSKK